MARYYGSSSLLFIRANAILCQTLSRFPTGCLCNWWARVRLRWTFQACSECCKRRTDTNFIFQASRVRLSEHKNAGRKQQIVVSILGSTKEHTKNAARKFNTICRTKSVFRTYFHCATLKIWCHRHRCSCHCIWLYTGFGCDILATSRREMRISTRLLKSKMGIGWQHFGKWH